MECHKRIHHRSHSHNCEQPRTYPPYIVTKVQEANGQSAEYHGEIQPAEECPLVGEEDFGFYAGGKGDAFSGGGGEEGLGGHGDVKTLKIRGFLAGRSSA